MGRSPVQGVFSDIKGLTVKVQIKLSLSLTKYRAIKRISCLITHHAIKRYWGSGGTKS